MYTHIGSDKMVRNDDVLFYLDYNSIKDDENFKNFFETIKKENKTDISQDNPKSIVITKETGELKAYITNISSITLANRKILK
jgi:hypothetical protein